MKRIFQIDHSARVSTDEADRHYETVHSPFARAMIQREVPRVRRYAWNRVLASRDLRGRFDLAPTAWRFILFDIDDASADNSGRSESLMPATDGQRLLRDHVNFLSGMRPFDVTSEVLVDRRAGQCVSAKFLFTFDAAARVPDDEVAARHDEVIVPVLADAFGRATGARLLTVNRVVAESETAPITEPGQRYTGAFLARSDRARIDEFYFDNHVAGVDFFSRPEVVDILMDPHAGRVCGHLVREWVAVDRT